MIYVILSAEIINKDLSNLGLILKIGYCRDDRAKVRTATYITENPTIMTLFTIPGGTEQDEKNLHHHFRKYLKYGNEWFSYSQEILDFFTTHYKRIAWRIRFIFIPSKTIKSTKRKKP